MQLHFLVSSANKMVDNVRGGGVAASTAEPFVAAQTLDDTGGVVYAAVSTRDAIVSGLTSYLGTAKLTRRHAVVIRLPPLELLEVCHLLH